MSYNPQTGLVYLPAQGVPLNMTGEKTLTQNAPAPFKFGATTGWNVGFTLNATPPKNPPFGRLIAWDPVKQKEAWHAEYVAPWNGGTLTTAGNLVFQGTADGRFIAYNATTGEKLWETPTGTGVVAAASTYLIDGVQYVSVAVGWGGVFGITQHVADKEGPGTVYTFAVGGKAPLPEFTKYQIGNLLSGVKYDPRLLTKVEIISPEWFEPGNPRYDQEMRQGYVPVEKIVLAPDCGMKYLPRESANGKMKAMADAAAHLRAESGG